MIDKLKLKSYDLLMAYDLPKLIERNTEFLREYLKKVLDSQCSENTDLRRNYSLLFGGNYY
jgi:hypothetical protein